MYFADTNLFIRYFTNDDKIKAAAVYDLLQKVKNKELEVTISEIVVVEIVQILSSKILYDLPRNEIRKRLKAVLLLDKLKLENKSVYLLALDLYTQYNIDFADCIIAAKVQIGNFKALYSYDQDFDKIEGINRKEEF